MRPYRTRVRKMRKPGTHYGRGADDIRRENYDPDIRAARLARDRETTESETR